MNRTELLNELNDGILEVTFTKRDGTKRVMNATLMEELITVQPNGNGTAYENDEVIRCFDTDIEQWRSFRVDSVIETKVV